MQTYRLLRSSLFSDRAHRSGWNRVLQAMRADFDEVLIDDFVDASYSWQMLGPHLKPWLGMVHNPFTLAEPFWEEGSSAALMRSAPMQESLPHCRGLIAFSKNLAHKLARLVPASVPVYSMWHPIEMSVPRWSLDAFRASPRLLSVGWWLRRFESVYLLDSPWPKQGLWSEREKQGGDALLASVLDAAQNVPTRHRLTPVEWLPYQAPAAYDALLASSVVFLDLIDASANNAVLECIAAGTPLLINPLPAVREYLGSDYPLYYLSLEEAAEKARDLDMLQAAHRHLLASGLRPKLEYSSFVADLADILEGRATPVPRLSSVSKAVCSCTC